MEQWIGDVVGKMHIHKISQTTVAEKVGIRRDYLNKILNGKEQPKGIKERIEEAVNNIIARME